MNRNTTRRAFMEYVLSKGTGSEDLTDAELHQFIQFLDEERHRLLECLSAVENDRRVEDSTRLQAVNKLLEVANGRLNEREFVHQFEEGVAAAPAPRPWFGFSR